jgi:hypothetical protein
MLYRIDPLQDARWVRLLARHPQASVFHTPGWLEALKRTYDYEPFAVTTSPPGEELKNGIAFCRVKSWLTGERIVSVPFADHCQPLVDSVESLQVLLDALREEQRRTKWKYIELRPLRELPGVGKGESGVGTDTVRGSVVKSFGKNAEFYFHSLDLRPDLALLFRNFHKSCVQRKIQRAEREQLVYEVGRSERLLAQFYHLLLLTRRRHQLPPQPLAWFRNLLECLGDRARIHVASKDGQPIASILTLFFKNTLVYKYGCSDGRFHNLGGMSLLFWKAIQEGKQLGAEEFDLGRSDLDNPGLAEFKGHLGAACSNLTYYSYPPSPAANGNLGWKMRVARKAFEWLPDSLLTTAGRLLYKHVG